MVASQQSIQNEPAKRNEKTSQPEFWIGVKTFMKNFFPAEIKQHPGQGSGEIVSQSIPEGMDMFFKGHLGNRKVLMDLLKDLVGYFHGTVAVDFIYDGLNILLNGSNKFFQFFFDRVDFGHRWTGYCNTP